MLTKQSIFLYSLNSRCPNSWGRSANFLDAGGQATTETMVKAFEIVLEDERVRVALVNIYGGVYSPLPTVQDRR